MSVHNKFLFYDGHYEASLPNQGIEGAASDPQVSGGLQYCFAGWDQQAGSATGSSRNKGGRGKPLPSSRTCALTCLCRYTCDASKTKMSFVHDRP